MSDKRARGNDCEEDDDKHEETAHHKKRHRCLWDGHKFDGEGVSYPNSRKPNGKFGFDISTFCSPSCEKACVDDMKTSPHLMNWLHLHCHRELGIEEAIPIAPHPRLLACNRRDGEGMSIQQFREFGKSHRIAEKVNNLPIDKRVWRQERQIDCDIPFYEVVRSERLVADMLYQDHKARGLPIPKTLIKEKEAAAEKEEKLRIQKDVLDDNKKHNFEDIFTNDSWRGGENNEFERDEQQLQEQDFQHAETEVAANEEIEAQNIGDDQEEQEKEEVEQQEKQEEEEEAKPNQQKLPPKKAIMSKRKKFSS